MAGCSSLTEISDLAFNYCKQLTNIDISDCVNLEIIGDYAFSYTSLENFDFMSLQNLKTINNYSFYKTLISGDLIFPSSLISIGNNAFANNQNIENVYFEENSSLTTFGDCVFEGCSNLKQISFENCSYLNTLNQSTFNGCFSLESIIIDNAFYKSIDGVLTDKTGKLLLYPMGKKNTEYRIPNDIVSIASGAFNTNNNTLQKITIPSSVKQIEPLAFSSFFKYMTKI